MDRPIVWVILAVLAVMNIVSFALMGYDKSCAQKGKWRVPERTLFLATACFGGLGGVLGMSVFRHKTKHWYFAVFFPLFLILQIAALWAIGHFWLQLF
ncbi:MAG: DUF1294 domain-containing protein [Lachnospiraceae bacterium]|nr:DUF1294 domain-containing protein [Lachnospiraceae bacterium]